MIRSTIEALDEVVGARVRFTDRGEADAGVSTNGKGAAVVTEPYSIVVEGKVIGWSIGYGGGAQLLLAGVPFAVPPALCDVIAKRGED